MLAWLQYLSWGALITYLVIYVGWLVGEHSRSGITINPIKYLFKLFSSYSQWYFTSWQADSLLTFGIAHRLMHGVQYMVIVNSYMGKKLSSADRQANAGKTDAMPATTLPIRIGSWSPSHRTFAFVGMGVIYVLGYQLLLLRPLDELGFGVVNFMAIGPQPRPGMNDPARAAAYDLFAMTLIQALPVTHYFFDSFIWKVSDAEVQQGL